MSALSTSRTSVAGPVGPTLSSTSTCTAARVVPSWHATAELAGRPSTSGWTDTAGRVRGSTARSAHGSRRRRGASAPGAGAGPAHRPPCVSRRRGVRDDRHAVPAPAAVGLRTAGPGCATHQASTSASDRTSTVSGYRMPAAAATSMSRVLEYTAPTSAADPSDRSSTARRRAPASVRGSAGARSRPSACRVRSSKGTQGRRAAVDGGREAVQGRGEREPVGALQRRSGGAPGPRRSDRLHAPGRDEVVGQAGGTRPAEGGRHQHAGRARCLAQRPAHLTGELGPRPPGRSGGSGGRRRPCGP